LKTIYPRISVESSSFFVTTTAAGLMNIRAQSSQRNILRYLGLSNFDFFSVERAENVRVDEQVKMMLHPYTRIKDRKFKRVLVGAGSGATAHIANCLDCPMLPSHTMVAKNLIIPMNPDNKEDYLKLAVRIAQLILAHNKGIEIIIHYDPIHDRLWLERYVINRIKFLEVNQAYRDFFEERIEKEGDIIFVYNSQKFDYYKIADNIFLQLGGYGGISQQEYENGSETIDSWLEKSHSSKRGGWKFDYEKTSNEESEWGTRKEFCNNVREYCKEKGYNFIEVNINHIMEASLLAACLWHLRNNKDGRSNGFLIETSWAHSPTAAAMSRYVPYWIPWADYSSMAIADAHLKQLTKLDIPRVAKFARYAELGPDIAGMKEWASVLGKYFGENIECFGDRTEINYPSGRRDIELFITRLFEIPGFIESVTEWAEQINAKSSAEVSTQEFTVTAKKLGLNVKK